MGFVGLDLFWFAWTLVFMGADNSVFRSNMLVGCFWMCCFGFEVLRVLSTGVWVLVSCCLYCYALFD